MDFSRQLKSLHLQCNEFLKDDGVFAPGISYQKLKDFIKFYDEIRPQLKSQTGLDNQLVIDKINALPEIEFKDFENPFLAKNILPLIGRFIFFPLGIFHFLKKYRYERDTKEKLGEVSSLVSSIEFLTRNN